MEPQCPARTTWHHMAVSSHENTRPSLPPQSRHHEFWSILCKPQESRHPPSDAVIAEWLSHNSGQGKGIYKKNTTLVSTGTSCSITVFTVINQWGFRACLEPLWADTVSLSLGRHPSRAKDQLLDWHGCSQVSMCLQPALQWSPSPLFSSLPQRTAQA